jgi:predicted Zn-dependent protease
MYTSETFDRRSLFRMIGMACGGAAATTLALAKEPKVNTPFYNKLTLQEEAALGAKFSAEFEKKVEILENPLIDNYLNGIIKRLGEQSQAPFWPYQVKVVNASDINAHALPGGFLYIRRGLLEWVEDENEMVGALAHEVGHVVARHSTNQMMLNFIAANVYEKVKKNLMLDNTVIARIIEQLGGPLVLLAKLKYGRDNEMQADLLGFYEMYRAGWHPNGLLKFFSQLEKKMPRGNALERILSDHPDSGDRARVIEKELQQVSITGPMREQSWEFKGLKAVLRMMPAAPKPEVSQKRG